MTTFWSNFLDALARALEPRITRLQQHRRYAAGRPILSERQKIELSKGTKVPEGELG